MTSPPSPPNRRRRRIVVVTIAVLVLGLGWRLWPRVDQRLVGKWVQTRQLADSGDGVLREVGVRVTFEYRPDGTGQEYHNGSPRYSPFQWAVIDGKSLVISRYRPGVHSIIGRIEDSFARVQSLRMPHSSVHPIEKLTSDGFTLSAVPTISSRESFKRVDE